MAQFERLPVVRFSEFLLVTMPTDLADAIAVQIQEDILQQLRASKAKFVLLDVSSMELIDSFMARTFSETARMAQTMNAAVAVCGMRPAVAITLVQLGLDLSNMIKALDIDHAMELFRNMEKTGKGQIDG